MLQHVHVHVLQIPAITDTHRPYYIQSTVSQEERGGLYSTGNVLSFVTRQTDTVRDQLAFEENSFIQWKRLSCVLVDVSYLAHLIVRDGSMLYYLWHMTDKSHDSPSHDLLNCQKLDYVVLLGDMWRSREYMYLWVTLDIVGLLYFSHSVWPVRLLEWYRDEMITRH